MVGAQGGGDGKVSPPRKGALGLATMTCGTTSQRAWAGAAAEGDRGGARDVSACMLESGSEQMTEAVICGPGPCCCSAWTRAMRVGALRRGMMLHRPHRAALAEPPQAPCCWRPGGPHLQPGIQGAGPLSSAHAADQHHQAHHRQQHHGLLRGRSRARVRCWQAISRPPASTVEAARQSSAPRLGHSPASAA